MPMSLGPDDLVLCAGTVGSTPFFDRLAPAKRAGFAAVSMLAADYDALTEAGFDATEIRRRVADQDLAIAEFDPIGHWLPGQAPPPHMEKWIGDLVMRCTADRLCPIAEAVGARSITVVEMFGTPVDSGAAAEAFASLCDRAREHGLLVHLEFLPFGGIPDLASAWDIVRQADRPNGGLLVDSWHLFRSGSTLADLHRIPGDRIFAVQINDAPAAAEADLYEEALHRRLIPGEGSFDLVGLLDALDAIGSRAPIGVEAFSDRLAAEPVDVVARKCAEAARTLMARTARPSPLSSRI